MISRALGSVKRSVLIWDRSERRTTCSATRRSTEHRRTCAYCRYAPVSPSQAVIRLMSKLYETPLHDKVSLCGVYGRKDKPTVSTAYPGPSHTSYQFDRKSLQGFPQACTSPHCSSSASSLPPLLHLRCPPRT